MSEADVSVSRSPIRLDINQAEVGVSVDLSKIVVAIENDYDFEVSYVKQQSDVVMTVEPTIARYQRTRFNSSITTQHVEATVATGVKTIYSQVVVSSDPPPDDLPDGSIWLVVE